MGLNIKGLPTIAQLSSGDKIVIVTDTGLKSLNSEVLGSVFSNTSLYERYNMVETSELSVQNISTHNKVRKFLRQDTSAEIYLEYSNGQINIIKATVILDKDKNPITIQAADLKNQLLYWSNDIYDDGVEFNDGMPWKNKDEEKLFMTTDQTPYPVQVYQYTTQYIRRSEILFNSAGDIAELRDSYYSNGISSRGTIEKRGNSFIIQLKETGKDACGLQISLNNDGTVTGKLIGIWDGLNDWDIEDNLTKDNWKEWFYNSQDYNTYVNVLSVSTSDKIGWYLNKDTSNHVFTEVKDNTVKIYLAQNKVSGTGSFIQEQARNMLNQPLYWVDDMTYQSGVSDQHVPVHNGKFTFMTTEVTNYPVYVYQYNLTELFTLSYELLPDNSRGVKLVFSGLNGKKGEIYKSLTQLVMRYLKQDGTEYSKLVLGESESHLSGNTWKAGDKILSDYELPEQSNSTNGKVLCSLSSDPVWTDILELDDIKKLVNDIAELVEKDTGLSNEIELLKTKDTELTDKITGLKNKDIELSNEIELLKTKDTELTDQTTELSNKVTSLTSRVNELENKNTELSTQVDKLSEVSDKTTELENKNTELLEKIGLLEQQNEQLSSTILELENKNTELVTQNGELVTKVGELESKNTELDTKVSELETTISETKATTEELKEIINSMNTQS